MMKRLHFSILFQAKHASPDNTSWGIDGENGKIVDMKEYGIWEPFSVKVQTLKTALEVGGKENY